MASTTTAPATAAATAAGSRAARRRRGRMGGNQGRDSASVPRLLLGLFVLLLLLAATQARPPPPSISMLLHRRGGGGSTSTSSSDNTPSPPMATAAASSSSSSSSSGSQSEGGGATEDMRGYDAHPSMFAPSGRIPQIEYAREAVSHGRPLVGVKAQEGVVLVGRKALESQKLQDGRLRQKLFRVDKHVLVGVTGMTADALALVRAARHYAQDYQRLYGEPIPVRHLAEYVCDVKHVCTMVPHRPFGVSLLVAGHDPTHGYQLYKTDPSASYEAWKGVAVGENAPALITKLSSRLLNHDKKRAEGEGGHSSSPSLPSLARACGIACAVAAEGMESERSSGGSKASSAGGGEETPLSLEERAALLEMAVVREKEVFFLEANDVKAALLHASEEEAGAGAGAVEGRGE